MSFEISELGDVLSAPGTPPPGDAREARKNYLLARETLGEIDDPAAGVKTRETLQLIERKMAALRSRPWPSP
jgi:hypothetical protein